MKILVVLFVIVLAGCANLDKMTDEERSTYMYEQEDRIYERQEALVEAKLEYAAKAAACEKVGGAMLIRRQHSSRIRSEFTETRWDYLHARCTKW